MVLRLSVEGWGLRETELGVSANCQPDGSSAFWILVKDVDKLSITRARFGHYISRPVNVVGPDLVTSLLPESIIHTPGKYPVFLVDVNNDAMLVGTFETISPRRKSFQIKALFGF